LIRNGLGREPGQVEIRLLWCQHWSWSTQCMDPTLIGLSPHTLFNLASGQSSTFSACDNHLNTLSTSMKQGSRNWVVLPCS